MVIVRLMLTVSAQPREFSVCPLTSNEEVNSWLKHFEVKAPLICQSVLVSKDPVSISSHQLMHVLLYEKYFITVGFIL